MKTAFTHLHVHTEYSMLDGCGYVTTSNGKIGYVERGKQLGMSHMAITDHGNIGGTYEFYKACIEQGIEPILGEEFYFVPNADHVKEEKEGERFHVVILARNEAGFKTIVELSSESHRHYYYKPLIDRNMLEALDRRDRKNLIVLSGCASSILSRKAMGAIEGSASAELRWWMSTFPKNFYIELQHHGTTFDKRLNTRLLKLARKYNLPWAVTNDPHYVMKDECDHHDALLAIQTGSDVDDPNRFRFDGSGYHLRSAREMERAFVKTYGREVWEPGCAETMQIAQRCKTRISAWDSRTWHIPKFARVDDSFAELKRLSWRGLRRRDLQDRPEYVARLKHELKQFKKVGMADFLLITQQEIANAQSEGVRVGPGRGSVCGTLVGYFIGLHKIDPIRYELLFERFLNPERPKMPDIDTDYPSTSRNRMIDNAIKTYGVDNTQRVGAFQTMQIKKAFGYLARAHGIDFKARLALAKKIEVDAEENAVLPPEIEEGYPTLHSTLEALTGLKSGLSRHAAGVIILDPDDPVKDLLPIQWIPSSKTFVSQFNLDTAAGIGLLKNDYLSLRTLDTIDECVRLVRERHGVELDPDSWIPDEEPGDKKVYRMLRKGKVQGVFQMEGSTNSRGIQQIACAQFEDIVACTSLYRKGPLDDGADKRFLKNKRDKKIRVAHKSLKKYLGKTWGEMIYQEQMFEILYNLAGFSWSRVDDAKTAMTKKDPEKMALLHDEAVEGFQKVSGMSEETAEKVWAKIQACAGYLFNRSHAVAYSMLTYQTARLKTMYPLEYMTALLRTVDPDSKEKKEKRASYMSEAIRMGFKILPPDINLSDATFIPVDDDGLRFGLQDIKDVGPAAVKRIIAYRTKKAKRFEKRGLDDPKIIRSVSEVSIFTNAKVMRALQGSGALTDLGMPRDPSLQEELLAWQFDDPVAPFRKKYERRVKLPDDGPGHVSILGEITKLDVRTTKTDKTYHSWVVRYAPGEEFRVSVWDSASKLFKLRKGSIVIVRGRWNPEFSNVGVGDADDVTIIKSVVSPNKTKEKAA